MKNPVYGPRSLTCQAVLQKRRDLIDPVSKQSGRCGECRACWRLFVHACKQVGKPLPKAEKKTGNIAGFVFQKRTPKGE